MPDASRTSAHWKRNLKSSKYCSINKDMLEGGGRDDYYSTCMNCDLVSCVCVCMHA